MPRKAQHGLSLIELMIAITLGMIVVAAVLALFLNISRSNAELAKTNRLIENGRFAIQVLKSDLAHAGYWGSLDYTLTPAPAFVTPTALPDPCVASGWSSTDNLLAIPVQGYANGSTLSTCGVTGVLASSDVLVVRHANTCTAGSTCDGGSDTGQHIQISNCRTTTPIEAAYVVGAASAATFVLRSKDCTTVAPRRKVVSNIYYIATSNGQPTLMRVALVNGAYAAPQPLIEGIEAFRVQYGIDNLGKNGLPISATNPGDGSPDSYVTSADMAVAEAANILDLHPNIVAIKIHVLSRNLETSPGYTDTKAYQLGGTNIAAANDGYKRHVFSTTIRLVNPSSRREKP